MNKNQSFKGIFEGNNHYIKGLYIKKESDFAGIFGYSTNTIQNLTIKDGYIENAGLCVGGIVGRGETIINCHNMNTTVKQTASYKIGGITGQAKVIESCTNTGAIIGNSALDVQTDAGGIAGLLATNGSMKECKNLGDITGIGETIGGIVGHLNSSVNIDSCSNIGKVDGLAYVGGIAGVVSSVNGKNNINLTNCYNIGNIEGQSYIGGILGSVSEAGGIIRGCYNIGMIEGNSKVGAIIGYNTSGANTIEKCYYLDLEGSSSTAIGDTTDIDDEIDSMTNGEMTTNILRDRLNTIDNSWIGNDGEYPKLKWE